jgi:hypothetical protein
MAAQQQADLRRRGKGEPEVALNEAGTDHDSEKDEILVEARISDAGGWDLFAGESRTLAHASLANRTQASWRAILKAIKGDMQGLMTSTSSQCTYACTHTCEHAREKKNHYDVDPK